MRLTSAIIHTLLLSIIICSLAFVGTVQFGLAKTNGTNENGIISSNTTWTLANSPYNITGNVTVTKGITLTIQPGVQVVSKNNFDEGKGGVFYASLAVNGTLKAVGDGNNPISFNNTQITFSPSSSGWNQQTTSGSIIEKSLFVDTEVDINSSPKLTGNIFTGEIESQIVIDGGSPVISNNLFTNNSMQDMYGWNGCTDIEIKDANNATIASNVIEDGMCGIGVDRQIDGFSFSSFSGATTIQNNLITNNKGSGIGCGASFPLVIENNTITRNYIGLDLSSFSTKSILINNNIFNNTGIFDNVDRSVTLESSQSTNVNATQNYWGTTDQSTINNSIRDNKDDSTLGTVNFVPFLNSPNSQSTPLPSAAVPEFPLFVILLLFLSTLFTTVIFRHRKTDNSNQ
jgi:parallel beta-helix repeat protein